MHETKLVLPPSLYGGDPRGFLDFLRLTGRPLGDNRWAVRPSNDRGFIAHYGLADTSEFMNRFDHLTHMPMNNIHLDDPTTHLRFAELEAQLAQRMVGPDIAAHFHSIQLQVLQCSNHEQLIDVVEQACALLETLPLESTGELLFANLSAHLVLASDLLIRRVRLPAIMFRFDQDSDAMKTIADIDAGGEGGYFASSSNWFQDVVGASHYYGPLLGCLSPGFWCVPAGRPPAAILFSLGRGIAGHRHSPMEPMQLLPGSARDEPVPDEQLSPISGRIAVIWWTNRLNQMFGYLCDPTLFSDKYGIYDPYEHQHWLLTFGQLFGLTTALQSSSRNHATQRALMNTLLDTYTDRIKDRRFEQLCNYTEAKKTADEVRAKMPEMVAAILMPLADRAVDSLRRVQDGFFFREQRGDNNVVVRIPGNDQGQHREPENAAGILLKVYRNATHGFGGQRPPKDDKELVAERLLSHHTGEIPNDLVYLPYLYLLDILCNPETVRETIIKHAAARGWAE